MRSIKRIAGLLVCLLALPTHAARPLDTDDAGVITARSCELEGSVVQARTLGVKARQTGAALACGVGWGTQIGLGLSQTRVPGAGRSKGASVLAKTTLWTGAGDNAPALSLGGALTWDRPAGGKWTSENRQVRLLGTWPVSGLILHANLGHSRDVAAGTRATLWGLAVEHEPLPLAGVGVAPLFEVYGDDLGDRWANAGLRVTVLPDKLWLDLAAARQLVGAKARATNAGFKFAF